MGRERSSDWYDAVFSTSRRYRTTPEQSKWYPIWTQALRWLKSKSPTAIVDIGCGPGHLAQMVASCKELGSVRSYRGLDFSGVALIQARSRVKKDIRFHFEEVNLVQCPETIGADARACHILCEFMEHVHDDLLVLSMVPPEAPVFFTVPDCGGAPHVRWFANETEVEARYSGLVEGLAVKCVGDHHYLAHGKRSYSMSLVAPEPSSPLPPGVVKVLASRPRGVKRGRAGRRGRGG